MNTKAKFGDQLLSLCLSRNWPGLLLTKVSYRFRLIIIKIENWAQLFVYLSSWKSGSNSELARASSSQTISFKILPPILCSNKLQIENLKMHLNWPSRNCPWRMFLLAHQTNLFFFLFSKTQLCNCWDLNGPNLAQPQQREGLLIDRQSRGHNICTRVVHIHNCHHCHCFRRNSISGVEFWLRSFLIVDN